MKSDIITIDNHGNGFLAAVDETKKVAVYREMDHQQSLQLQLFTEELLSLARSVTGEMSASFWIESEGMQMTLHLSTQTVMDREKRAMLLSSATSRKNDAAKTFLGKLRDVFEAAMLSDTDRKYEELPAEIQADLVNRSFSDDDEEWDGYERSILRKLADDIRIGIRGGVVDMTVIKDFAKA